VISLRCKCCGTILIEENPKSLDLSPSKINVKGKMYNIPKIKGWRLTNVAEHQMQWIMKGRTADGEFVQVQILRSEGFGDKKYHSSASYYSSKYSSGAEKSENINEDGLMFNFGEALDVTIDWMIKYVSEDNPKLKKFTIAEIKKMTKREWERCINYHEKKISKLDDMEREYDMGNINISWPQMKHCKKMQNYHNTEINKLYHVMKKYDMFIDDNPKQKKKYKIEYAISYYDEDDVENYWDEDDTVIATSAKEAKKLFLKKFEKEHKGTDQEVYAINNIHVLDDSWKDNPKRKIKWVEGQCHFCGGLTKVALYSKEGLWEIWACKKHFPYAAEILKYYDEKNIKKRKNSWKRTIYKKRDIVKFNAHIKSLKALGIKHTYDYDDLTKTFIVNEMSS